MNKLQERVIPRLEELRKCFETPNYEYTGFNSNGTFGLDIVENDQVKTLCSIKDDYICIICRERSITMSLIYIMNEDRIHIDYNFQHDDITEIQKVSSNPEQTGIELVSEEIQYLLQFYQYLQTKRTEYENRSN